MATPKRGGGKRAAKKANRQFNKQQRKSAQTSRGYGIPGMGSSNQTGTMRSGDLEVTKTNRSGSAKAYTEHMTDSSGKPKMEVKSKLKKGGRQSRYSLPTDKESKVVVEKTGWWYK